MDERLGELAAVRVADEAAVGPREAAALDERTPLPFGREAVILERHDHERREEVVEERDVDVRRGHARHVPELSRGPRRAVLLARRLEEAREPDVVSPRRHRAGEHVGGGLTAVARESAHVGARAPDAATAFDWAVARGQQVAAEYGLGGVLLDVDTSSFEVQSGSGALVPGEIRVRADTTIDLSDVPLVAWAQVQVPLERRFAEVVDPYRSAPPAQGGGG